MRSLRILVVALLASSAFPAYAQQWDQVNGSMQVRSGPTAPLVIIDQTNVGQKIISLRSNGTEVCYATATAFTCTGGFTFPTSCTGTYTGPFTNGVTSTGQCVNGSAVTTTTSTAVTSTVPLTINANGGVTLVDDAVNILAQRNGTAAQTFRVGPAAGYLAFLKDTGTNAADIFTSNASSLRLGTQNSSRWEITTSGHLIAFADNTYDIGASGASRPRNIYVGTGYNFDGGSKIVPNDGSVAADGKFVVSNSAGTAGVGLDFATDGTLKIRNRSQTADATLTAGAIKSSANYSFASGSSFNQISDGVLQFVNNAGAGFTRLILGTNDASGIGLTNGGGFLRVTDGNSSTALEAFEAFSVRVGSITGPLIISGAGTPEGTNTAPPGSLYLNTNGGAGITLYVKESGTGNTGWVAK